MNYQIKFSNQATKFFRGLPYGIQERMRLRFSELSKNPKSTRNKIKIKSTILDKEKDKKILR